MCNIEYPSVMNQSKNYNKKITPLLKLILSDEKAVRIRRYGHYRLLHYFSLCQSHCMFHNLVYWILILCLVLFFFFVFKGDIAANLLQDEIAKEKQVLDLKHQLAKTAVCL